MSTTRETWWNRPAGGREVLRVALPLVISTSSWTVMQFIDRMFLIWYSEEATAAALPAGVLNFALLCFFFGLASYSNTFVAQYSGAARFERIGLAMWQGVWAACLSIPVMALSIPLAPLLFQNVGHPPAVAALEVSYFQILAVGGSATVISAALSSFFTGRGDVCTVMCVDIAGAVMNIVLDYAWIFGHWGCPEWGVSGAAWATVVALWFKVVVYLILALRPQFQQQFGTLSGCRFDAGLFARLLRFGTPAGLQFFFEMVSFTLIILLVGRLGKTELAATNLAFNVNALAFLPIFGFGMAASTLVGQRLGEDRPDLAARATWTTFVLSLAYTLAMSVLYVAVPRLFLFGYESGADPASYPAIQALTVVLLRYVAAYCLLDSINVIFVSALKGAGDTRFILLNTIVTSTTAAATIWAGHHWLGGGLHWAWSGMTVWICALGAIYLARFLHGRWRSMRVIEPSVLSDEDDEPALAATEVA